MQKITLDNGLSLAYEIRGKSKGIPVVFVHGFAGRAAGHEDLVRLMDKKYYMLLIDQRGHGDADKPVGKTYEETVPLYSMQLFCDDLKEVITKLKFPTPFVIFGHSMGGMIVQEFVLRYPKMVSHVVLGSTLSTYNTDNMKELLRQFKSGEMKVDEPTMKMMSELGYTLRFKRAHPELIAEELQYKLIMPPWAYIACIENFVLHFDVRNRLGEIQQPTLVHTGDRDALINWTYSEFLAKHIPHAKLVIAPKQNHGTIREVPEDIVKELDALVGIG
jgi:pimeloyl-ACP methyl ester carboxylesterase